MALGLLGDCFWWCWIPGSPLNFLVPTADPHATTVSCGDLGVRGGNHWVQRGTSGLTPPVVVSEEC